MKHVLVTIPVEQRHKEYLEAKGSQCRFHYVPYEGLTDEDIQAANMIIGNVPPGRIRESANLQWLQLNSAGADHYCADGVLRANTKLTNSTGAYGPAISEYMLGVLLSLQKKLPLYYENQKKHLWMSEAGIASIYGSTTLALGLGDIGGEFAKRMKALGSHVIGVKRNASRKPAYVDELYTVEELDEALPRADIIAMSLPNTPKTRHIINAKRLSLMKPSAVILNVGRGTSIDTAALCKALAQGQLGGCVLDVTDPEPLPADHPLWDAPNTLITPHISGQFQLQESGEIFERIVRIAGDNLERFLAGKPLNNEVDFSTGYRRFLG